MQLLPPPALLLLGCERSFQNEAIYEGYTTSQWVEELSDDNADKRRKAAFVLGELGLSEAELTVPCSPRPCPTPTSTSV